MKTPGMPHQLEALRRMESRAYYALFMEQGTGKTWTFLADAERGFEAGKMEALLVFAPNGVHRNWVRREIPQHLGANYIARAWQSGAGKRQRAEMMEVFSPNVAGRLRILAINIEAMITESAKTIAQQFVSRFKTMIVVDESSRIKNPNAGRTKAIMELRPRAVAVRIGSGTPITNAPIDIFAQFEFMKKGLLQTSSYRAFVAEYAELLPPTHRLVIAAARNSPRAAHAQIVAKDERGRPMWKNLDKLERLIAPHMFRVLKRDCLTLPDKIYTTQSFVMSPAQQRAYELMKEHCRVEMGAPIEEAVEEFEATGVLPVKQQAALSKLLQITGGFVILPEGNGTVPIREGDGKMQLLRTIMEDLPADESIIIWAHFTEEQRAISAALTAMDVPHVTYNGQTSKTARDEAIDLFQGKQVRAFVGQPKAAGIGLTLTAASTVVYYSKDFNLETRLQSEDRCHRIGTKSNVVYIDLVAEDTIDETVGRILVAKAKTAASLLGDRGGKLPG
jgi:SNF2 family DNA or RNA helicase